MSRLASDIDAARPPSGAATLWWLGQAGFSFKTRSGTVVYVDPYLSDAAHRLHGFKRLSLPAIEASEVRADIVVLTHEHTDHLDPDAIPVISAANPRCVFAAPAGCAEGLDQARVSSERRVLLTPGVTRRVRGVTIHAAPADHGSHSPTAVAVALDLEGVTVMLSGDSSWRSDFFQPLYKLGLDVCIPCINGGFGNMSHVDAAKMVGESGASMAIPCHFWTFAEQGAGDPMGFLDACRREAPHCRAVLLSPGERVEVIGRKAGST
jgi:L-ascorbate 6-phosphate lactonase